jgi:hypothetical protein
MANRKISEATTLTGANVATGDLIPIVDISDTTDASSGTTKKITAGELGLNVKRYIALLAQAADQNPTATVLENTLSAAIVWARTSTGLYTGTLSNAFTVGKTVIRPFGLSGSFGIFLPLGDASNPNGIVGYATLQRTSANVITWDVLNAALDTRQDWSTATGSSGSEFLVDIRVYP